MDSKSSYKTYRNDCLLKVADLRSEYEDLSIKETFEQVIYVR